MPTIADRIWSVRNLDMVRHFILSAERIIIIGHTNPDGDSIGALLSLGLGLESIGKEVHMVCHDQIPKKYKNLPGISQVVKSSNHNFDLAIAVDCGSKEMIGPAYEIVKKANQILEIDHHRSRIPFGDISFVDPDASSAGELVYELLLDLEIPITTDIAQNILTSILVETNSFRLPAIRPRTFELCADLLRTGVNFHKLAESVYWVTSKETALLSGICLSRCKFSFDGQIAWSMIYRKDLKKIGATDADADPITEKLRSIQGVKIAILIRENSHNQLRISIRSKDGINVSAIAEKFGGGGHLSAAGCTIPKKKSYLTTLIKQAETVLETYLLQVSSKKAKESFVDRLSVPEKKLNTVIPAVLFFDKINESEVNIKNWSGNEMELSSFEKKFEQKMAL
jgi:phosphoesterase RecJ-like protein